MTGDQDLGAIYEEMGREKSGQRVGERRTKGRAPSLTSADLKRTHVVLLLEPLLDHLARPIDPLLRRVSADLPLALGRFGRRLLPHRRRFTRARRNRRSLPSLELGEGLCGIAL
jgi:hypothetical protein